MSLQSPCLIRNKDGAAKAQFDKAKTAEDLPAPVMELIDTYLSALNERDSWNVDIAFNYVRDTNVNNVMAVANKLYLQMGAF